MFEKLKEYGTYVLLGVIALGALSYAYVSTTNQQKGAELHEASLDAMVASTAKSEKLKKNSTVADDLLKTMGGKSVGQYKIDDTKVTYVIGETYSDILNNKKTIDLSADLADVEDGKLRTILIAQPATQVNGEDVNAIELNSDHSVTIGETNYSQGNLKNVSNDLKGYNVSAIGYGLFNSEKEAKEFRDTYFNSYEVYEVGTTGKYIILNEYNTTRGGESLGTKINSSTTGDSGEVESGDNEYLELDENGITVKAKEGTICGNEYTFQGNTYYVACNKNDLQEKLFSTDSNAYAANRIVTTQVTDMSSLFEVKFYGYGGGNFSYDCELAGFLEEVNSGERFYGYGSVDIRDNLFFDQWQSQKVSYEEITTPYKNFEIYSQILKTENGEAGYQRGWGYNYNFNIKYLKNIDLSNWDTSNVTDMSYMFFGNEAFNGDISKWNTGKVTNMEGMFSNTRFNQPIGDWNVSHVTNMADMFSFNLVFDQNIGSWNVSNVTTMNRMFSRESQRTIILANSMGSNPIFNNGGSDSIKNWDISSATDMSYMFYGNNVFNQPIGSWNTSNVQEMEYIFGGCPDNICGMQQDLNGWDLSGLTRCDSRTFGDIINAHC